MLLVIHIVCAFAHVFFQTSEVGLLVVFLIWISILPLLSRYVNLCFQLLHLFRL